MKTKCKCCGSKNIRRCGIEDKDKFEEGVILENIYECGDCGYDGVFDFEDMKEVKNDKRD